MSTFTFPPVTTSASLAPDASTESKQDVQITLLTTIDADTSSIDTKTIKSDTDNVTVISSTLPTGAARETKQDDQIALLATIDADTSNIDTKTIKSDTDNVTIVSSTLPSGAATASNQSTTNASLSNIESDINDLNAKLASGLVPEVYDNIAITYVTAGNGIGEIETVVYKLIAATIATLTLTYDVNDKLSTVTRS